MSQSTTFALVPADVVSAQQMAEHDGLVRWVVRQQWLGGMPFDDALHEGRIGLWAALRRYDPQRGTAFSTYAVPAIARAVWRAVALHHRSPLRATLPLAEAPDPADLVHQAHVRTTLLDLLDHLPPRLRQVIVARYGLAHAPAQTFAAIGQTMGITRQRVHQLHAIAILWLAHPAHSLSLRRLLERNRRCDYQEALARQRRAARSTRQSSRRRARP